MSPYSPVWKDPRIEAGMRRQLELRAQRLGRGEEPLGWKVAFSAPAALHDLDLEAPLIGFLTDRSLLIDGSTVEISSWQKPALEPEIAVHLKTDLAPGASRDETAAAIDGLGAAIELADVDVPAHELEQAVATDLFQRRVVLGQVDRSRAGGDAGGIEARVYRDGSEAARTDDPEGFVGNLVDVTRHVANYLGAFGEHLASGQVIITGSVVPLVWLEPGEEVRVELDPLGTLSLNFSG
jgi:2-keto-4-pentenoate hydratase